MPTFEQGSLELYYEVYGEGFPVLLFAPGGMRSAIDFWTGDSWNVIDALTPHFQVIAMDQRNAGKSHAPIAGSDGWHSYAEDHVALLDHLDAERCHVLGGCIGGPYCFGVVQAAPDRVASAVLQQTIGYDGENRQAFYDMFDSWAQALRADFPDVSDEAWSQFRSNMYDGDFVFNVSRDFVRACQTPLLILKGDDLYHPAVTSLEIAELAPNAELVEDWKGEANAARTAETVVRFLQAHTP
jgi:pimeloyl-ACP methyl ester carboxylesterase